MDFASIGSSSNGIISMDPDVNTFLYDGASHGLRVMPAPHAPKHASVSLTVATRRYGYPRRGGGTFSFDTTSGVWSEAGDWALPFYGRIEYAPELALWFGFTSEGRQLATCDLGAASPTSSPVLQEVWDEFAPPLPPRWVPVMSFLLPLGAGKFLRWCRGKSGNDYLDVETFAVLTGVEVVRGSRGALRMIRHKSRRYSVGCSMARLR
uniref:Uncharacterized protein n=1 Tax=Setaria viridis TaxID=4556 RepID=A0A4U6WS60_SETVI|nr:hypothetical protein SEVIR_1G352600v2 [Setaria viridis]